MGWPRGWRRRGWRWCRRRWVEPGLGQGWWHQSIDAQSIGRSRRRAPPRTVVEREALTAVGLVRPGEALVDLNKAFLLKHASSPAAVLVASQLALLISPSDKAGALAMLTALEPASLTLAQAVDVYAAVSGPFSNGAECFRFGGGAPTTVARGRFTFTTRRPPPPPAPAAAASRPRAWRRAGRPCCRRVSRTGPSRRGRARTRQVHQEQLICERLASSSAPATCVESRFHGAFTPSTRHLLLDSVAVPVPQRSTGQHGRVIAAK